MDEDRRRSARVRADFLVECELPTGTGMERKVAYTRDLSARGIGLFLKKRGTAGTPVNLSFRLPATGERVCVTGRVAWSATLALGPGSSFDTGVELVDVPCTDAAKLALHLRRRIGAG